MTMATNQEQMGINVPMHKRIAMGEKLDGSSLQPKGQPAPAGNSRGGSSGALAQAQKK
jgi:hypothetical protein